MSIEKQFCKQHNDPITRTLSRSQNLERDIHKKLKQERLALPIPITTEVIDASIGHAGETEKMKKVREIPVLRFSDTVRYLVESGNLNKLVGEIPLETVGPILKLHWERWCARNHFHHVAKRIRSGELNFDKHFVV